MFLSFHLLIIYLSFAKSKKKSMWFELNFPRVKQMFSSMSKFVFSWALLNICLSSPFIALEIVITNAIFH